MSGNDDGTSARRLYLDGAAEDGGEAPARRPPSLRLVEGNTPSPPPVAQSSPPGPDGRPDGQGQGLLLGHIWAQHVGEPQQPQITELPSPVRHVGEIEPWDDWIGFRPAEAATIAAAAFPTLPADLDPLRDGTGRRVDPETGEIIPAPVTRTLIVSGGLIRLAVGHGRTTVDPDEDQALDDQPDDEVLDYKPTSEREARDVVLEFSRKSRNRLRMVAASIDWHHAYRPGSMLLLVTLTYPGQWRDAAPTPDTVTRHRKAFGRRYQRATGYALAVLWKREFQERGAPHLHLLGWWPWWINEIHLHQWLSATWFDVVGTGDPAHLNAGTRVDVLQSMQMSDPLRLGLYFAGYTSAKGSKEYQNQAPEEWCNPNGSVGRYWGVTGLHRYGAEVLITETDMVTIERLLRKVVRASIRDTTDGRRPRTRRTRYSRTGRGPNAMRRRHVHRRYSLISLKGIDSGFAFLTKDGPRLGLDLARAITLHQAPPWPRGQRRPLP